MYASHAVHSRRELTQIEKVILQLSNTGVLSILPTVSTWVLRVASLQDEQEVGSKKVYFISWLASSLDKSSIPILTLPALFFCIRPSESCHIVVRIKRYDKVLQVLPI